MRLLLRPTSLILALLSAGAAHAQASLSSSQPRFAFVVIGPTASVRGWTSEWMQASLARSTSEATARIAPWRNVLGLLDTEAEPLDSVPPLPGLWSGTGPSAHSSSATVVVYPADLRQPLPIEDLRAVVRAGRLESFTQIVVTKGVFGYRLVATTVEAQASSAPIRCSARGRRLQLAAEELAAEVSVVWRAARDKSVVGTR